MTSIYFIFISILCYLLMFLDCFYWFILFENNCAKGQRIILEEILLLDSFNRKNFYRFQRFTGMFLAIDFCDTQTNPQKLAKKIHSNIVSSERSHSNIVSTERDSSSLFNSYFTKYRNISKIQKPSTFPRAAKTILKHDDTIEKNNSINTNHYFLLWVCVYHKYVIGH